MEDEKLLHHEGDRAEHNILAACLHVVKIFKGREVVLHLPDYIWQENGKRDDAADPDPGLRKFLFLWRKEQSDHDSKSEEESRMFVQQAKSGEHAKPHPQPGVSGLNDADQHVNRAHPEPYLKNVHGHQATGSQIHGNNCGTEPREALSETAS